MRSEILRIPFSPTTRLPISVPASLFGHIRASMSCTRDKMDTCLRPVGLAFDNYGRLFATVDSTGDVVVVRGLLPGENLLGEGRPVVEIVDDKDNGQVAETKSSVTATTTTVIPTTGSGVAGSSNGNASWGVRRAGRGWEGGSAGWGTVIVVVLVWF